MASKLWEWLKVRKHQYFLAAAVLLAAGSVFVYLAFSKPVQILVDDQVLEIHTYGKTVGDALRSADITPHSEDKISPDLDQLIQRNQVISIRRARPIMLIHDGEEKEAWSSEIYAGNILAAEGITLFPDDLVWLDGVPFSGDSAADQPVRSRLEVLSAEPINVSFDGKTEEIKMGGYTLAHALWNANLIVYQADWQSSDLALPLSEISRVEYEWSFPLRIKIRGEVFDTRVLASTVAEAIENAGTVLIGLDRTKQSENDPIPADNPINITRVVEEVVLEQEPLPFDVVYQADPEALIDTQSLLNAGEYGVEAERIRVRYENGTEAARLVEGNWTVREPEARVVGYGTRIEIKTLNTPDGPIEYWRAIDMEATSYSPSRAGVPDDYPYFGITACGIAATKGVVAVDRTYIPFYTPLYIPGYGTAIACDTGSAIIGRKIDLGYDDNNWESWHWPVTVYFLTPVPDPANIAWIIP